MKSVGGTGGAEARPSPGTTTPGFFSLNTDVPQPGRGRLPCLLPPLSPAELGEKSERRFKPKLPVPCPSLDDGHGDHMSPVVFNSKMTILLSVPGCVYLRVYKIVPEIGWHLPPFKKGGSGADSGFRCPLVWPRGPRLGRLFLGGLSPAGRPEVASAWRVRASACDVHKEVGKGRSPVGSSASRKFLKALSNPFHCLPNSRAE